MFGFSNPHATALTLLGIIALLMVVEVIVKSRSTNKLGSIVLKVASQLVTLATFGLPIIIGGQSGSWLSLLEIAMVIMVILMVVNLALVVMTQSLRNSET